MKIETVEDNPTIKWRDVLVGQIFYHRGESYVKTNVVSNHKNALLIGESELISFLFDDEVKVAKLIAITY